eukprot:396843-Pelagomonas_calceolata.AAC.3
MAGGSAVSPSLGAYDGPKVFACHFRLTNHRGHTRARARAHTHTPQLVSLTEGQECSLTVAAALTNLLLTDHGVCQTHALATSSLAGDHHHHHHHHHQKHTPPNLHRHSPTANRGWRTLARSHLVKVVLAVLLLIAPCVGDGELIRNLEAEGLTFILRGKRYRWYESEMMRTGALQ